MSYFQLNGTDIKNPTSFKISKFAITKSNRLADGTMSMELIAKKRKFFFTYDAIETKDKETIMNELWESDDMFFTLDYQEDGKWDSAEVYAGELPATLHRVMSKGIWVWKDFNFNLVER